jgi:hypothetical protein
MLWVVQIGADDNCIQEQPETGSVRTFELTGTHNMMTFGVWLGISAPRQIAVSSQRVRKQSIKEWNVTLCRLVDVC